VILVIGQLGKLLGQSIDAREPLPQLWEEIRELGSESGLTVPVAAVSLASLFVLRLFVPKLPAALLVVVASIGVPVGGRSERSRRRDRRGDRRGDPVRLPSFDVPTPALDDVVQLLPAALGIFLVSFADEI
jgi:sulfate permease, SulP family